METAPGLPEHEKKTADVLHPERTRMPYVTYSCHWMQKHKFGITCPNAPFMEIAVGPPKNEK
jgi:hypothetical protein